MHIIVKERQVYSYAKARVHELLVDL